MIAIEKAAFMSINASIGCLGITALLLCAFCSSHLQQKLYNARVSALMTQATSISHLNCHGTMSSYISPPTSSDHVTLAAFAHSSHTDTAIQLCFIVCIVFGELKRGSVLHLLSWGSHKSRRPVRSTVAAEIIVAGETLNEIVSLLYVESEILDVTVQIAVLVDSKDLFKSLSSQGQPPDKLFRRDVNFIRFYH